MIGTGQNAGNVYLIDYGLAKCYRDKKTKDHIAFHDNKRLLGTPKFSSLNAHLGYEQSRRDDLESLGYTMIYLLKGRLPWEDIKLGNKTKLHDAIMDKKMNIQLDRLCRGLPPEILHYMMYCRELLFESKPDYFQLRRQLAEAFARSWSRKAFLYDWVKARIDLTEHVRRPARDSHKAEGRFDLENMKEIDENDKKASRMRQIQKLIAGLPKKLPPPPVEDAKGGVAKEAKAAEEKKYDGSSTAKVVESKTPPPERCGEMSADLAKASRELEDLADGKCDFEFNEIFERHSPNGTFSHDTSNRRGDSQRERDPQSDNAANVHIHT